MFAFCRSIYFCNRRECVLDIVPKHRDTLDQIKSLAGVNLYWQRQFKVRISAADQLFGPEFFTDYAFALTTGKVPPSLTPKFLVVNNDWFDTRVRRDSNSSISTYPLLTSEDKGENESDITSVNLNVTPEDDSASRIEVPPDQSEASEASDTEANNPDTVVEPMNDSNETSSTSSEEEQEDTTLKKTENPSIPEQKVIPSVCTPASPWKFATSTDHSPDKNSHPPTPNDPFRKSDEQPPPVPDKSMTPAKATIPKVMKTPIQKLPTTPARKTPLHKPRYTPEHPK